MRPVLVNSHDDSSVTAGSRATSLNQIVQRERVATPMLDIPIDQLHSWLFGHNRRLSRMVSSAKRRLPSPTSRFTDKCFECVCDLHSVNALDLYL